MKKKLSVILVILYVFNLLFPPFIGETLAYFSPGIFSINGSSLGPYMFNPGSNFYIDYKTYNDFGESIKSVYIKMNFGNNAGFNYNGVDQKSRINSVVISDPIPSFAYNSFNGFNYEITNGSNSEIGNGITFDIIKTGGKIGFTVNSNISTYQNDLNAWVEALKVSDNSLIVGSSSNKIIYANVRPHITNYYFEKSDGNQTTTTIQGSNSEPINLVLKVKDYNGCTNIDSGLITANLSQLGLGTNEALIYDSCEADLKTAVFKKTGITTNVSNSTYNFDYSNFYAKDEDNNENTPNDSNTNFDDEDKKDTISLTVVSATAPSVSLVSLNNQKIGGPEKLTYTFSFSGSQVGSGKISLGSDGSCVGGTTLYDWFDYNDANIQIDKIINSSQLQDGINNIYACIKNSGENIGSINISITKDTNSPVISIPVISPSNVIVNDSSIKYNCLENGYYRIEKGGNGTPTSGTLIKDWTNAIANTDYTTSISNTSFLVDGTNIIYAYCKDEATNLSFLTGSITKVPPIPAMGNINSFSDTDLDYNGLDGRDINANWIVTDEVLNYANFESYRIYLLPSNVIFDKNTQTYIKIISNKNTSSWTGDTSISKDSLNQNLESGGSYKICIAIMGTSGQLGNEISCSSGAIITSDTVQNPKILSARFTTNTNLELTTDATLDTNLFSHNEENITYFYNGSIHSSTAISSVNGQKINLTIPSLNSLSATGTNIIMLTGALHSDGGGYNNYFESGSIAITDGQNPTITSYSTGTTSLYNSFYSGSLVVNYTFVEQMKSSGYTKFTFDRTAGNNSTQKIYNITDDSKLTSGSQNITLNLSSIGLVSGTTYDMKLIGQDLAGNSVNTSALSIKFDNSGPTAPVLVDAPNTSSQTPNLSWNASTDDNGNGSGIKDYTLKVYSGSDCSGNILQTHTGVLTTSKTINTIPNGNYSWNVFSTDNMSNTGSTSNCDNFLVDTNIPTISNLKITDTTNNNSNTYTKFGNTIKLTANLTNTNSGKIKADLSTLTSNDAHANVYCNNTGTGNITCNYIGGVVEYTFNVGFAGIPTQLIRQIKLTVSNDSDTTTTNQYTSITVDNTAPTNGTITSPTNQTYGGDSLNVTWSGISDTNLDYIKIEYSTDSGNNYNLVYTGANSSPYNWNISSLGSGNGYKIKITAYDKSGNTSQVESQVFSIDKSAPTITPGAFNSPTSGENIKGNNTYTILWNTGSITDNQALPATPITLEYSTNSGTNWTVISSSLANTGSYNWTTPNISSNQMKLRMKAIDNFGNTSEYETLSYNFIVDSSSPTFSITTGTPPNGAYINSNGFDVIGTAGDNINVDNIYYSFKNNSNNTYWNGTSYVGTTTWNLLSGSINSISYNLNTLINPTITNGENYDFSIKVIDKAGNIFTTTARQYIADMINPSLIITNNSGSYFSGSINISGTSSDALSGLSSVKISIKKGNEYWNGNAWVGTEQLLTTSTNNNYANWNYILTVPSSDNDGQNYEIIVYSYDKSYKVNNSISSNIILISDKIGPTIENDIFTFTPSGIYIGGNSFNVTWNPAKVSSSGANLSHIKLEYNKNGVFTTIIDNTTNDGSYSFNLPSVDDNIRIIISAYDTLGNISNTIASNQISIDSTAPEISSIETMDMTADGQIDALNIIFSEDIKDSTITLSNFNISGVGIPTSWETGNTTDDNIFLLKFTNTGSTSTIPTLSYTKGTLTDIAGKFLENTSNFASIDKAVARVLSAEIFDSNNDGKFGKIVVNFSENIQSTTDSGAFSLNNAFPGMFVDSVDTSGNIANVYLNDSDIFNTDSSTLTLDFTTNNNWKDASNNVSGSKSNIILIDKAKPILVNSILRDVSGDYVADKIELTFSETLTGTISGFSINTGSIDSTNLVGGNTIEMGVSGISGTVPNVLLSYTGNIYDNYSNSMSGIINRSVLENISPKLVYAGSLDQNGNGKIDGILFNFSENLNSNVSDILVSVNSYTVSGYSMSGTQNMIVSLNEKSSFDSDSTPEINIISNSLLKDLNNNIVLSQSKTTTDTVGPVIIGARYEPTTHKIFLDFGENINNADFITTNFILNNAGSYSITGIDTGEKSITLSNENINYSTSTISFVSNTVRDTIGNKQILTNYVAISAPIIINEVMISNNTNNNYIELHNLSSSPVSLNGWTIAGITIPNDTILANGYYLISKSNKATSNINIDPNLIGNIDLSGTGIALNNGSVDIDKASLTTGLGNTSLPASIERKNPSGNGLTASNWYKSLVSTGFDNTIPLGTPGVQNVFDSSSPTLTTNITNDTIIPVGNYSLNYNYSDNIGVNTGSISFTLSKWNSTNFVSNSSFSTGTINNSGASFNISGISYGRYKLDFSISDTAGNVSSNITEFYVDNFSFNISTGSINLGILSSGNLKLADDYVDIEIKTIGAGFSLNHNYNEISIGDWDGNKGFGACEGFGCSVLEDYKNKNIVSQIGELQSSGALKTYNYKVKYGSLIDGLQPAGVYQIQNNYDVSVSY